MASLLKASVISVAATVISLVAGFGANVAAARLLGPGGSGTIAYALWIATSAAAAADLGLPQTLLRHGSDAGWRGIARSALRLFTLSTITVGAILLGYALLAPGLEAAARWTWALTAALFLAYAFAAFSTAVARSRNRFGETAATTLVGGLLQVPLVLLGGWFWGPAGALIGHVVRYLPQALRLPGHLRGPVERVPLTREMRAYGRNMWLSDLIEILVLSRIEYLFFGQLFTSTQVGLFAAGLALAGLVEQLSLQLSPALIVGFADPATRADRAALDRDYARVTRVVLLAILPICMGGAAIMPALMPLLFGPAFVPAIPAATLLLGTVWLAALCVIPWGLIAAAGRSDLLLRVQIVSGLLNILLLAIAIPAAGLIGAATARTAIHLITLALLIVGAARLTGVRFPWSVTARALIAGLACAGAALVPVMLMEGLPALLIACPLGALTYALAIRLLRLVDREDARAASNMIAARLPAPSRPMITGMIGLLAAR